MKKKKDDLVWYACYGSNIDEERFLKYLQGGKLKTIGENVKEYARCEADPAAPRKSKKFLLSYKLLFGKESKSTWGGHGVAFIGKKKNKRTKTYSRIYLISKTQFNYLFGKENGTGSVDIDYAGLDKAGQSDFKFNFYNRLVVVGKAEGYPIYTFTNSGKIDFNKPCQEYLTYICNGIKKVHKVKSNNLVAHFAKIRTGYSKKQLAGII